MVEGRSDIENVLKAYLPDGIAGACIEIVNIHDKYGNTELEEALEPYIYSPSDVIDDHARKLGIMGVVRKHTLLLLEELGIVLDPIGKDSLTFTMVADLLICISDLKTMSPEDAATTLSMIADDNNDIDIFLRIMSRYEDVDVFAYNNVLLDISPALIANIINVLESNILDDGVIVDDSDATMTSIAAVIVNKLIDTIGIQIPTTIMNVLTDIKYKDGVNETYLKNFIKKTHMLTEKYEDGGSIYKFIKVSACELMFIYKLFGESDYILSALADLQEHLAGDDISKLNRELIAFDKACSDSGLYLYIKDDDE